MTQTVASAGEAGRLERFEAFRRPLSWLCVTIFTASFLALLALSATSYWTPDNRWVVLLDGAWRLSGVAAIVLWLVPRVGRATDWLAQRFS